MFVGVLNTLLWYSLRETCPYSELFWSVFSRIRTKYGEIDFPRFESKCGKMRTRITPDTDTFHAVTNNNISGGQALFWRYFEGVISKMSEFSLRVENRINQNIKWLVTSFLIDNLHIGVSAKQLSRRAFMCALLETGVFTLCKKMKFSFKSVFSKYE